MEQGAKYNQSERILRSPHGGFGPVHRSNPSLCSTWRRASAITASQSRVAPHTRAGASRSALSGPPVATEGQRQQMSNPYETSELCSSQCTGAQASLNAFCSDFTALSTRVSVLHLCTQVRPTARHPPHPHGRHPICLPLCPSVC